MSVTSERTQEAFTCLDGRRDAPVVLTCEHASDRLPEPWRWPAEDARLRGTHWTHDLGAAELTAELARALDLPAVLSRFTRLLVDPNRGEDEAGLFRRVAEGAPVALNEGLDAAERERRLAAYHRPYHGAVHAMVAESDAQTVLSMHSFTPLYEGRARPMHIGVLFNHEEALAGEVARALVGAGFLVALNEPYSGREGLIYAAERHAGTHGRRALELEVRQDLATDPSARRQIVGALARFFAAAG